MVAAQTADYANGARLCQIPFMISAFKRHALIPLIASGALSLASPVMAAPAIWEVQGDNSVLWLFGSFHVLPAGLEWRTKLFDELLGKADQVVFETDITAGAALKVSADAFAQGIYVDGTLLTDVIDSETATLLRDAAGTVGLPFGTLLAMKPWMATNAVSVAALASHGYDNQGVEFILQAEIAPSRMTFLETGHEQVEVLSGAPEAEQVALLKSTLAELDTLPKMMSKMMGSWAAGMPERLARLFEVEMGGYEDAFLDRLLNERNVNWMPPLEAMLASHQDALVIVGAGHLTGAGSVVDLLEQQGYSVKRIQ